MEKVSLFVPGRLCLFGEHTDWAGRYRDIRAEIESGSAIVTGIDLGIYAEAQQADNFTVVALDERGEKISFSCPLELETLRAKAKEKSFFAYVCGVAAYMLENYLVGGLAINVTKVTLPIKKGLSSSAAICVLVAKAFNEIYQLKISNNGLMQAAYRGEMLTQSRCGRLDQACVYGVHPIQMEFSGEDINVTELKVGCDLPLVFVDLCGQKDTKKILADLNHAYPFPSNAKEENLHAALGVENQQLVQAVVTAMAAGDLPRIGALMTQAQALFDAKILPCCPEQLTAPKLHQVLQDPTVQALSFGGKGVGSGGDGSAQFMAKSFADQQKLVAYLQDKLHLPAYAFTIPATKKVTTAIIPLAGFGTRLYPATRFVKKEFLPILDRDGFLKPILLTHLEELDAAGIQKIILIIGREEQAEFDKMLHTPLSSEHLKKLPDAMRHYEKKLAQICQKIKYVYQEKRCGFGHAVYQAAREVGAEPVLLYLGDFVFRSHTAESCATQLINAYHQTGKLTLGVKPIALEEVVRYGVVTGSFAKKQKNHLQISDIVEKPTVQYAKDFLGVSERKSVNYYATFGQYILTPAVFSALEKEIAAYEQAGAHGEVTLTNALRQVMHSQGMVGICLDGTSFDAGVPQAYRDALWQFGAK